MRCITALVAFATVIAFELGSEEDFPRIELISPVANTFSEVPLLIEYSVSGSLLSALSTTP